jgi:hypothetical protein
MGAYAVKRLFERTSRACDLVGMTPELADAIKAWAEENERTPLLAEVIAGCETASKPLKRSLIGGLLGASKPQLTGMLLTPKRLIWSTKAGDDSPYVVSVKLADAEVRDYQKQPEFALAPDDGVQVFGFIGFSSERGTVFLGLGEDPDGHDFKEKLLATWRAARE